MKTLERIRECKRLVIDQIGTDGGMGHIHIGTWEGSVIWSTGGGWDHVSVRPFKSRITPTWDDMCTLKGIFFEDNEVAIQIHPEKDEYVNNLPNCLHLWAYQGDMPLPPSWMVGVKNRETVHEAFTKAIRELEI